MGPPVALGVLIEHRSGVERGSGVRVGMSRAKAVCTRPIRIGRADDRDVEASRLVARRVRRRTLRFPTAVVATALTTVLAAALGCGHGDDVGSDTTILALETGGCMARDQQKARSEELLQFVPEALKLIRGK